MTMHGSCGQSCLPSFQIIGSGEVSAGRSGGSRSPGFVGATLPNRSSPKWTQFWTVKGSPPFGALGQIVFYELCGSSSFWDRQGARRIGLGREPSALWSSESSDHENSFQVENLLLLRLRDSIRLYCSHEKGFQVHLVRTYAFGTWHMNGWLIS